MYAEALSHSARKGEPPGGDSPDVGNARALGAVDASLVTAAVRAQRPRRAQARVVPSRCPDVRRGPVPFGPECRSSRRGFFLFRHGPGLIFAEVGRWVRVSEGVRRAGDVEAKDARAGRDGQGWRVCGG